MRRSCGLSEADQVGAALPAELVGAGEHDVLRRQLAVDVVVGEVRSPQQQAAGDGENDRRHATEGDQHPVDGPAANGDDRLGRGLGVGRGQHYCCSHGETILSINESCCRFPP